MIIDWDKDDGKVGPARVFDAEGIEYTDVLRCDTETGEIEFAVHFPDGTMMINDDGNGIKRFKMTVPTPLRIEQLRTTSIRPDNSAEPEGPVQLG